MQCLNYKHGWNICRHFQVLAQFPFTTSESQQDYYYQKVNVQVVLWIAERVKKTKDLKKPWNFNKITQKLGINGKIPAGTQNETLTVVLENC